MKYPFPSVNLPRPFLAALALVAAAAPLAAADELEELLARGREAVCLEAWEGLPHGLALVGEGESNRLAGAARLVIARDGCCAGSIDSRLPGSWGWDGQRAWRVDHAGLVRELALTDLDADLLVAWISAGLWCDPDGPLHVDLPAEPAEAPSLWLSVPGSELEGRLELDPETYLPAVFRWESRGEQPQVEFGAWDASAGLRVPREIHSSLPLGEAQHLVVSAVEAVEPPEQPFALPRAVPRDVRFHADRPAALETRRVSSGQILVRARVDGAEQAWFILDTGAGAMVIDPAVADGLEMERFGYVAAVGVAGSAEAAFRQGVSVEAGPLEIANPIFVELELGFLESYFGVPVAGILGYDLFARAVVSIELELPSVELFDPRDFEPDGVEWSELSLAGGTPAVRGRFEGDREGLFMLDTGMSGAVTFEAAVVVELDLLADRELGSGMIGGVGGFAPVKTGALQWFELGGHRFEQVQATFELEDSGAVEGRELTGTIGSELLDQLRVVFDYSRARVAFVERAAD